MDERGGPAAESSAVEEKSSRSETRAPSVDEIDAIIHGEDLVRQQSAEPQQEVRQQRKESGARWKKSMPIPLLVC